MKLRSSNNHALFGINRESVAFYLTVVLPLLVVLAVFFVVYQTEHDVSIDSPLEFVKMIFKYSWLTGFLFVLSNLAGTFLYGSPKKATRENVIKLYEKGWDFSKRLIVTYVSRGDNYEALARALKQTHAVLAKHKVNFVIEIVTDIPVQEKIGVLERVFYILVPDSYETKSNTRYKARALQYALEKRRERIMFERENTWILHLDEESVVTEESLAGMHEFMQDETKRLHIGQGEIKYNAYKYGEHPVITAIDAVRTGDDLGRFRFQYKFFHRPIFGMHGSYVLVPMSVEHEIGFDLGGKGSITEDAYFALKAYDEGYQFDWVEGYIREQSPFSLKAIIKQRRRWFCGLVYLSVDKLIQFKTRKYLLLNMILWGMAWVGPLITLIDAFTGGSYFPLPMNIAATGILGGVLSVYVLGTLRNLEDMHEFSKMKKFRLLVTTIVLLPFSSFIEGVAIIYAILSPVKTFDIVAKN